MDMAPFAMMKGRYGYRRGYPMGKSELVDTMVNDALWDATGCNMHMLSLIHISYRSTSMALLMEIKLSRLLITRTSLV